MAAGKKKFIIPRVLVLQSPCQFRNNAAFQTDKRKKPDGGREKKKKERKKCAKEWKGRVLK